VNPQVSFVDNAGARSYRRRRHRSKEARHGGNDDTAEEILAGPPARLAEARTITEVNVAAGIAANELAGVDEDDA
jgi:hypothetical protein